MAGSEKISELEYEKSSQLIDALPYIDEITPEQKQTVDALLRQEVLIFIYIKINL